MLLLWPIITYQNINKLFSNVVSPSICTYDYQFLISSRYFQKSLNNQFLSISITHLPAASLYIVNILADILIPAAGTAFTILQFLLVERQKYTNLIYLCYNFYKWKRDTIYI